MNNAPLKQLGDVSRFIRGITFEPSDVTDISQRGTVICMRTKNVQEILDQSDVIAVPARFVKREEQYLQNGDILVSSANSWNLVGKCCWVPELPHPSTAGGFISILRANQEIIWPKYLYRWLSYERTQHYLRQCGRQTTNISNLKFERAEELKIPLPPLKEQKRIAALLDKADELRRKRRESIAALDSLTQSIFLDLFGDPVINPKKWKRQKLSEVGTLDRGKSKHRPRNAPELLGGPYPLVQTGDVANSGGRIFKYSQTYSEIGLQQSRMWPAGTLCITIAANIAKTGILMFDACFPDSVVGFHPNDGTRTEYVQMWLSFLQKHLEDTAPESAQKNINLEILRNLTIPIPPIDMQIEFVKRCDAIQTQRTKLLAAQSETENLFLSLQQKAFAL